MCWRQAGADAKDAGRPSGPATALAPFLDRLRHRQLFLADLQRRWSRKNPRGRRRDRLRAIEAAQPRPLARPAATGWIQGTLFEARRDLTGPARARPDDPWLAWALHLAHQMAEVYGWTPVIRDRTRWGLAICLAEYAEGEVIRHSQLYPALRARNLGTTRTIDVLDKLGIYLDDRLSAFEIWLARKLATLAPGMRADVENWVRHLHEGGPRTKPRSQVTARLYLTRALPALTGWSTRYGHLREVTRTDITDHLDSLRGQARERHGVALRSLFRWAKRNGRIFANPTTRIKVGVRNDSLLQPLEQGDIDAAVAASTTPAARVMLVLAAVHAARGQTMRRLLLDDVDLGNRRIVLAGRVCPMDELTRHVLTEWLAHRREQWPNTANPHLLIHSGTAVTTKPVGKFWVCETLKGKVATLDRLRMHRQLDEALVHGPDPLHLSLIFGLSEAAAIRYAASARALLAPPPQP
ncbi:MULTISPECIES: hypothetical protein [unclassified Streptomyces]|uniref:hypothetical protein n=1 Tax=unclassified Streptomyces TaxID=2593676 RepID=UPI0024A7E2F5|nr:MULTISPECIES: hypothetical protein [unclassified Streptomyces]